MLTLAIPPLLSCTKSITTANEPFTLLDGSQQRTPPTVRVTAAGVAPVQVHVDHPVTVTFTNDDRVAHLLEEAPELGYDPCPEMRKLGTLGPGQAGTVTIERAGVICAYRDAAGPKDKAFQGVLVVH